jgi:biofilm PGA synthesis N-glycosyltransferase PgaC
LYSPIDHFLIFIHEFTSWISTSTPLEITGVILIPILLDFIRSYGKSIFLILHAVFMMILRVKRWIMGDSEKTFTEMPGVSLIIPAHNEERSIIRSIESALETNYRNKEVIVVDDGSSDRTYERALPYARKGLIKLAQRSVSGSKAGAVNYGLLFAKNDIIIVVDADTLIERNSLRKLVTPFIDSSVIAVSGNVRILGGDNETDNLLVKLQSYEYLLSLDMGRRFNAITGTIMIIPGAFGSFRREIVKSMGGYDSDTITEDFDITLKMLKTKGRICFAGDAISWTFAPDTWRAWRRQRIRWTRGQIETLHKHRDVFSNQRFGLSMITAYSDMFFMDFSSLLIKTVWMVLLPFFYSEVLGYVLVLLGLLYILSDVLAFLVVTALSSERNFLSKIYLIPLMVFFYRPYYGLVRLKGYFDWFQGTAGRW